MAMRNVMEASYLNPRSDEIAMLPLRPRKLVPAFSRKTWLRFYEAGLEPSQYGLVIFPNQGERHCDDYSARKRNDDLYADRHGFQPASGRAGQ
ncbi:hypothetical protein [Limoniibacter endophyticus]|uniref:hypothetical protein n=1 Tax=Limoniibacter endophyticus TaxID=1565040 RepID=UPI00167ABEDB|nr:hypothetical protein [Limoniibacter endophyticus]